MNKPSVPERPELEQGCTSAGYFPRATLRSRQEARHSVDRRVGGLGWLIRGKRCFNRLGGGFLVARGRRAGIQQSSNNAKISRAGDESRSTASVASPDDPVRSLGGVSKTTVAAPAG